MPVKKKSSLSRSRPAQSKKKKSVSVRSPKKDRKDQLLDLAKILSSEADLQRQEERLSESKKRAKEKQKRSLNKKIEKGEVALKEEEILVEDQLEAKSESVVQKIKLYEWEAPIRVSFPFDKKAFLIVVAASLAFILYLAILGHYGLMFAIAALLFFIYVAGTTEPVNTNHTITSQGIDTFDKLYQWKTLRNFWFTRKNGELLLVVETKLRVPANLILLLKEDQKRAIFMLLQEKLLYKEIKRTGTLYKLTYGEYLSIESI